MRAVDERETVREQEGSRREAEGSRRESSGGGGKASGGEWRRVEASHRPRNGRSGGEGTLRSLFLAGRCLQGLPLLRKGYFHSQAFHSRRQERGVGDLLPSDSSLLQDAGHPRSLPSSLSPSPALLSRIARASRPGHTLPASPSASSILDPRSSSSTPLPPPAPFRPPCCLCFALDYSLTR